MFLPLRDHPNPVGFTPWVTRGIVVLNLLIHVLGLPSSLLGGGAWNQVLAAYGYVAAAPDPAHILTSMFLHANAMHLGGNLLFLWIYGDNVEYRLGRLTYLAAYLVCGVAATLGFAAVEPENALPLVGASGAISGVLGMYFVFFPRNEVEVLLVVPLFARRMLMSARLLLGIYLLLENLLPALISSGGGVAYGAHIGGFLAGLVLAGVVAAGEWLRRRGRA